jgi:TPP-dependent indolepyruvate ferredoxin oxidoreductase alpha subunit
MSNLSSNIAKLLDYYNIELVNYVPGLGATEVSAKVPRAKLFFNEEVAFSSCVGASLVGKRSATLIKSQGFAKLINALTSTLSVETHAACLIFVFDDVLGKSSDNILRTLELMRSTEVPVLELSAENSLLDQLSDAVHLSEKYHLPVAVYVNCEDLVAPCSLVLKEKFLETHAAALLFSAKDFNKLSYRHHACPLLTTYSRDRLLKKLEAIKHQQNYELCTNPPQHLLGLPGVLPAKLQNTYMLYEKFFIAFKEFSAGFTAGDAGTSSLFGFAPYYAVSACTYMGGSTGMALGAALVGEKNVWAVTGDFSFFSTGILGWQQYLGLKSQDTSLQIKLVIFSNGVAAATGGQLIPKSYEESFFKSYGTMITKIQLATASQEQILNIIESSQGIIWCEP